MPTHVDNPSGTRDYYRVLGVASDADQNAIKEAFRGLALKYHPDRNKAPEAQERFKEIAAAYAVLSDPEKRKAYDARGFAGVAGLSEGELFRGVDFGDLLGGLGLHFGHFGSSGEPGAGIFERFFGRHRQGPAPGPDIEVTLEVPLSRIATGGDEKVSYERTSTCPTCQGARAKDASKAHDCTTCNGTGQRTKESRRKREAGEVLIQSIAVCSDCRGTGRIIEEPCPTCNGGGTVQQRESLTVNVPVGAEEGMVLRIPGHGMPSADPRGPAGDVLVVVRSARDPRFERHASDLLRHEELSVAEAVLGSERTVPTLAGDVVLKTPEGARPGLLLRIPDKGLPRFGGGSHGDLYVRVDLRIPQRLSQAERALYEQLRALETETATGRSQRAGSGQRAGKR